MTNPQQTPTPALTALITSLEAGRVSLMRRLEQLGEAFAEALELLSPPVVPPPVDAPVPSTPSTPSTPVEPAPPVVVAPTPVDRSTLAYRTYRPAENETASLLSGVALDPVPVDLSGQRIKTKVVYTNKTIIGCFEVLESAEGTEFNNCFFPGQPGVTRSMGVVNANSMKIIVTLNDCLVEVAEANRSPLLNGVQGCGIRLNRTVVRYGTDCVRVHGGGRLEAYGSVLERTYSCFGDPDHAGGWTHSDTAQLEEGIFVAVGTVLRNVAWQLGESHPNPVVTVSQLKDGPGVLGMLLDTCWVEGGGAAPPSPAAPMIQIMDTPRTGMPAVEMAVINTVFTIGSNPLAKGVVADAKAYAIRFAVAGATRLRADGSTWSDGTPIGIMGPDGKIYQAPPAKS